MSAVETVKRAGSPREAIMALAQMIDQLNADVAALSRAADAWEEWGDEPEGFPAEAMEAALIDAREGVGPDGLTDHEREQHRLAMLAMQNTAAREIHIPKPSEEKMERRRMLERQQLKLATALGADAGDIDWTEAYAKGGPWWLWQNRRDLVMSYNFDVRRMMVEDVAEDSADLAYEMSLDLLKQASLEPDFAEGSGGMAPQGWKENAPLLRSTT